MNTLSWISSQQCSRHLRLTLATTLLLVLVTALSLPTATPVLSAPLAQKMPIPSGDAARFVQLFPALKQLPAPAWLAEGVRFTYAVQNANVNAAAGTGSGGGYLQHNLIAADHKSVAVMSQFYLENDTGALTPTPSMASLALPAAGDVWLSPAVLVDAEQVANDELTVVRQQRQDAAGKIHATVRFQSSTAKLEQVWEFDERTGVLIFFRLRYGDAEEPTQLTQALLVNQRQLRLPWHGSRTPAWVKPGEALHYTGSFTALLADGSTTTLPYHLTAAITQRDQRWSIAHLAAFSNGVSAGEQVAISGVGQLFGGLWLPAEALHAKPTHVRLDRDPVTGAQITWQQGTEQTLLLTERGDAFETVMVYDSQSGLLIAYQQTITLPAVTTTVALGFVAG